ncbi:DUF2158 domain-containing protein [Sphingomonas sp. PP-CC-3G-468]|uniref:YodC family protein n=1 Tax=Sphingomonas sp. PP-CC-3G-468 TaxID=2135656 RepID=UPI0010E423FF|nr:DUF2158 domain-containing protein [Sphingomonas sp. PP-CC-3G-468]TCM07453.1 uncharacterized protein DUF2158 [Sphingomonas sp. PP-CC-3G-468]
MANEAAFKPGDLVQLKSGGPVMTVSWSNNDELGCQWWNDAKSEYVIQRFVPAALVLESD